MIVRGNERNGDFYDTMQVCIKNGHKITEFYDTSPENRQNNCDKCGSKTTTACSSCGAKIRGYHHLEHVIGGPAVPVPKFCHNCGKSYPWRRKIKDKKTRRITIDFKNTQWLFTHIVFPLTAATLAGYLIYRFKWNK